MPMNLFESLASRFVGLSGRCKTVLILKIAQGLFCPGAHDAIDRSGIKAQIAEAGLNTGDFGVRVQEADLQDKLLPLLANIESRFGEFWGNVRLKIAVTVGSSFESLILPELQLVLDPRPRLTKLIKESDSQGFARAIEGKLMRLIGRATLLAEVPIWDNDYVSRV